MHDSLDRGPDVCSSAIFIRSLYSSRLHSTVMLVVRARSRRLRRPSRLAARRRRRRQMLRGRSRRTTTTPTRAATLPGPRRRSRPSFFRARHSTRPGVPGSTVLGARLHACRRGTTWRSSSSPRRRARLSQMRTTCAWDVCALLMARRQRFACRARTGPGGPSQSTRLHPRLRLPSRAAWSDPPAHPRPSRSTGRPTFPEPVAVITFAAGRPSRAGPACVPAHTRPKAGSRPPLQPPSEAV
jgi:hypothetical protein